MAPAIPNTVLDSIIACGVNNVLVFGGNTQAQRIANEDFDNDFESCRYKSNDDLKKT